MKKLIVLAGILLVVLLAGIGLAMSLVDREAMTAQLQDELGSALGLEIDFAKPLHVSVWPAPQIQVNDVSVHQQDERVASARQAIVRFDWWPLLWGDVQPQAVLIDGLELRIERIEQGAFSPAWTGSREGDETPSLRLPPISLSDADLRYIDQPSERQWLLQGCDLEVEELQHSGGSRDEWLASLAVQGMAHCERVEEDRLLVTDVRLEVTGRAGELVFESLEGSAFAGELNGRLDLDLNHQPLQYSLNAGLDDFSLNEFVTLMQDGQQASGRMTLSVELTGEGRDWLQWRQSARGELLLQADDVVLHGVDLDAELDDYIATQRFNLIDVGAVFLAGPVGLAASRGYSFTGLLQSSGERTPIDAMASDWSIADGQARARDVALRTEKSRLAVTGALDFIDYRFADLRVAVIDVDGCAIVEQRINGSFDDPDLSRPNVLVTAMGPILDLMERGLQALDAEADCEVVYSGRIDHP
ncbi:AsmA family protein [Halopseudomonas salegens]|uniref:AsmA protein n=1 Tax=Halopseudomonas salegens TaxID=1434072 RepID=A0A1H2F1J4_9GAMM|nr:AsmA family protein [Halopseudomonas salegens]SDU01266.1 AsmA protein [Halopseudomonas salegens]